MAVASPTPGLTSTVTRTLSGYAPNGQWVAMQLEIDFTPTGGNFALGQGTASLVFTAENVSGLYPFQSPDIGNPVMTGFNFNLPPGAEASYQAASMLADGTLYSTGGNIGGEHIDAGTSKLVDDRDVTGWYVPEGGGSTGNFGIFTNSIETDRGARGGIVDSDVFGSSGELLGTVFPPIVIGGPVRFTLMLTGLNEDLMSASDLLEICSSANGTNSPSSLSGRFLAAGQNGAVSAHIGESCLATPTRSSTWGSIKQRYH